MESNYRLGGKETQRKAPRRASHAVLDRSASRGRGRGVLAAVKGGVGGVGGVAVASGGVPEPCTACGRPEQPERFHSHPLPPSATTRPNAAARLKEPRRSGGGTQSPRGGGAGAGDAAPKSSVRKPLALKFRSGGAGDSPRARAAAATTTTTNAAATTAAAAAAAAAPAAADEAGPSTGVKAARGLLLCYLCGKEFGRSSLPLHEPHCLQRWERENDSLPPALRRAPPPRPAATAATAPSEWNRLAWEASQMRLVPCTRCGRTFAPDRLPVHERSCRAPPPAPGASAPPAAAVPPPAPAAAAMAPPPATVTAAIDSSQVGACRPPGSVPCYVCGRLFGSASIAIHSPQCLQRWRQQNERLPAAQRRPEPLPPAAGGPATATVPVTNRSSYVVAAAAAAAAASSKSRAGSSRRGRGRGGRASRGRGGITTAAAAALAVTVGGAAAGGSVGGVAGAVGGGGAGGTWAARCPSLCYLCGRPFGSASIAIHERACRERWRRENAELPPHLRRQEPEKPCVVYRADGSMDMEGTMEAIWQSHLDQLVPCTQCGRTFYPDRLQVHQRACKGPRR